MFQKEDVKFKTVSADSFPAIFINYAGLYSFITFAKGDDGFECRKATDYAV